MSSAPAALHEQPGPKTFSYANVLKASALYSVVSFAPVAVSVFIVPLYARFLQPSAFGVLELLESTRNVFSLMVGARFVESLLYFYGRATTDRERAAAVSSVM